jgi:hypothetical protein
MTCQEFSLLVSAQLDGRTGAQEELQLQAHLKGCAACRHQAAELDCLRENLRRLQRPQPSVGMTSEILEALQLEARLQARAARQRADLIDLWRMRIFSQSVGAVVSFALFFLLSSVILKPIYRAFELGKAVATTAGVIEDSDEVKQLTLLLMPPPPSPRPIFNPSGALLGFSESLSEEDEFIAAVIVDQHGHASIKEVVDPPRDPAVITRLSDALFRQISFQPATRRGRFVRSDAVLMFSKVNVPG